MHRIIIIIFILIIYPFLSFSQSLLSIDDIDPRSLIYDHVSAVTGEYCEKATDVTVRGPDNIEITRYYNSYSNETGLYGWRVFSHTILLIGKTKKGSAAYCGEHKGSILPYICKSDSAEYKVDVSKAKGMVNNSGKISGQTNYKNNSIKYDSDNQVYELTSGNGLKRIYKRKLSNVNDQKDCCFDDIAIFKTLESSLADSQYFLLSYEILPSGNKIFYEYDQNGQLVHIEAKNSKEDNLFGWIDINYESDKIIMKSSDDQKVEYHFETFIRKKNLLKKVISSLNPEQNYSYNKKGTCISKKEMPEGRFLEIKYIDDKKNDYFGKVSSIKMPSRNGNKKNVLYNFSYDFKKTRKGKVKRGVTLVKNNKNAETHYEQDKDGQLTSIIYYSDKGEIYKKIKRKWSKKLDRGMVLGEYFLDSFSNVLKCKKYEYDKFGNVIREKLFGNLSGEGDKYVILQNDMEPSEEKNEFHTILSKYSQDGFNLLLSQGSKEGSGVVYIYLSDTNLLRLKLIKYNGHVEKRYVYKYNEDCALIETMVDDGFEKFILDEIKNMYISKAIITEIEPKKILPNVGCPLVIRDKVYDDKAETKQLINKYIFSYDKWGNILSKETFDSDEQLYFTEKYEYEKNNLISETDRAGNKVSYTYDLNNNIIKKSENLKIYEYKYDLQNNKIKEIQKIKGFSDRIKKWEYDDSGNLLISEDSFKNGTTYEYDCFSRLIKVTFPLMKNEEESLIRPSCEYKYDIFNNIIEEKDLKGYITTKKYNSRNQISHIFYPDKTSELFVYDIQGSLHRKLTRKKTLEIYAYDFLGRNEKIEYFTSVDTGPGLWLGDKVYEYDAFNLIYYSEEEGIWIKYDYDSSNRCISQTAMKMDYSSLIKNKKGVFTGYNYDSMGRESEVKKWYGTGEKDYYSVKKEYDYWDNITKEIIQDSSGKEQIIRKTIYNDLSEPVSMISGSNEVEFREYDGMGNITQIRVDDITKTLKYDYFYKNDLDQNVLTIKEIEESGLQKEIIYDAFGRVSNEIISDADSAIISAKKYFYDANGNLSKTTDDIFSEGEFLRASTTKWIYGPMNRLEKTIEAYESEKQKETEITYNDIGQIVQKLSTGMSKPIIYEYILNESEYSIYSRCSRIKISYPEMLFDNAQLIESDNLLEYEVYFDQKGRIIKAESPTGVLIERDYDESDNLIKERIKDGNRSDYTINYENDRLGRIIGVQLPDETWISYSYNGYLPKKVSRQDRNRTDQYIHFYNAFDKEGNLLNEQMLGEGGIREHIYDKRSRKIAIKTEDLQINIDKFDSSSNILSITRNNNKTNFSYDSLNQVTSESGVFNHNYKYDSVNNLLCVDDTVREINELNQLLKTNDIIYDYSYDDKLICKREKNKNVSYIMDTFGRLSELVIDDQKIKYSYDIFGRRLSKTHITAETETTESYLYLGAEEIGVLNEKNKISQLKIPGAYYDINTGRSIAFELQDNVYIPIYDFQGNVTALIDSDYNEIVERYEYSAFGEENFFNEDDEEISSSAFDNPWRFADRRKDKTTGLINFGLRDYDPKIQRWITSDPMGFIDGINKYAFVHNNPLKYIDLRGTSKHHHYIKCDSFEEYFYNKRTYEVYQGADLVIIGGQVCPVDYGIDIKDGFENFIYKHKNLINGLQKSIRIANHAYEIFNFSIGLVELSAGLAGVGGSLGLEVGSFGLGTVVAVPVAAGSIALIADGAVRVGTGVALFSRKAKNNSHDHNLDKQHKGTPKSNVAQNKQAKGARKKIEQEIGRKLNKDEQSQLHDIIHGQNYGYWEIVEEGLEIVKKIK